MPDQQQEPLKVYELAKELGLDSFALLDKLKQINIEVKSHMSSLASDQLEAIREAFKKEKKGTGATSAVKKRSASSEKTTTKKVTKKSASAGASASDEEKPAAKAKTKSDSAPKRKVIKRRSD